MTIQSNRWRKAARRSFAVGADRARCNCSIYVATCTLSIAVICVRPRASSQSKNSVAALA
jgi:hypothetical protein